MLPYLFNLIFGWNKKCGINIKNAPGAFSSITKSKCDLVNKPDRVHMIKDSDIIPAQFRAYPINKNLYDLNSKFLNMIIKEKRINGIQKKYLDQVSLCQKNLLMHPVMSFQDPLDKNLLVFVVFTSKSNDVLVLPVSREYDQIKYPYYVSSNAYDYRLKSNESLLKNDLLKPMDHQTKYEYFNENNDLYDLYVDQVKIALNIRLNHDISSINVNNLVPEYIYKVVKFNKLNNEWSEIQWSMFEESYANYMKDVTNLIKQVRDE